MLMKAAALLLVCAGLVSGVGCSSSSTSRYLYAALPGSGAGQIVAYREDPNSGALTQLASSPITAGASVESLAMHPSGKYLYAANAGAGNVSEYTIGSSGSLTAVTPSPNAGTAPTLLAIDPAGAYLYVANTGSFDITIFSIDASTGVLTQVGNSFPIGMSALNMQLAPSGGVLYVTGAGSPGFIQGFMLSQGTVTGVVPNSPFLTGTNPTGLAIDPGGKFLYTANRLDNSISEFPINADGSLGVSTTIGESYTSPAALFIDKSGKYLYVANQGSGNLAAYSIGATDGSLALLSTSPFGTGSQPSVIAGDPSGKYLFVGNQASSALQSFQLDGSSGTLTSVSSYAIGSTPTSIVLTP